MQETPFELEPDPSRLIEGLRDTGYTFSTALADIVDNSVDAGAEDIDIHIRMDIEGSIVICVADNGCGMDKKALLNGMRYGSASQDDEKRLGKFGLGMKTASTAYCRVLSVISRPEADDDLIKAVWDLDHVAKQGKWELLVGSPDAAETEILEETASGSSGTLVIWSSVDRLLKAYADPTGGHARRALDKEISFFREHARGVYQRFLDPDDDRARNLEISINGEVLTPWDPFCETESDLIAENTWDVKIGKDTAPLSIRAFVLPRREEFSTTAACKEARLNNPNQGVYVYRENRMIYHGWLRLFKKEPHLSLLRVELNFDHNLDEAFQVDIKKSQIEVDTNIYEKLSEFLGPPRNAANERYRKGQRKAAGKAAVGVHASSNRVISEREGAVVGTQVVGTGKNRGELSNKHGSNTPVKIHIVEQANDGEIHVHPVESLTDGLLWEPAIIEQHHAVLINMGHEYYQKVYVANIKNNVTIQGMDSLLWALAEAEHSATTPSTRDEFRELRYEVSRILRKLLEDLPEPALAGAAAE